MQEVVHTEIVKLLDNGIIYPISQWVSLVRAVLKKSGFTVVKNEKKVDPNSTAYEDSSLHQL